jgi:hypothetical protein
MDKNQKEEKGRKEQEGDLIAAAAPPYERFALARLSVEIKTLEIGPATTWCVVLYQSCDGGCCYSSAM